MDGAVNGPVKLAILLLPLVPLLSHSLRYAVFHP
jgi:hypothetical protein